MSDEASTAQEAAADARLRDDKVASRVVLGTAARGGSFLAVQLLGLAGAIVTLRYLGADENGRYAAVLALATVFNALTDVGLSVAAARMLSLRRPGAERQRMVSAVAGVRLSLSIAVAPAMIAFALLAGYPSRMIVGVALAALGVALQGIFAAYTTSLQVELRQGRVAVTELMRQSLTVLGIVVAVKTDAGLVGLVAALPLASALMLLFSRWLLGRGQIVRPRLTRAEASSIVREAAPIAIASIIGMVQMKFLVILMSIISASDETGYYGLTSRLYELAGGLPMLVTAVVLPVLTVAAAERRERFVFMLGRLTVVTLIAGCLGTIVFALAARPLVFVLGGADFEPSFASVQAQAPSILFVFLSQATVAGIVALGAQRRLTRVNGAGLLGIVPLGALLVPLADSSGAAVAATLGDLILVVGGYVALRQAAGLPLLVRPGADVVKVLLAAAVALAAGLAATEVTGPVLPSGALDPAAIAGTGVAVVLFLLLLAATRTLPGEVGAALRRSPRAPA